MASQSCSFLGQVVVGLLCGGGTVDFGLFKMQALVPFVTQGMHKLKSLVEN